MIAAWFRLGQWEFRPESVVAVHHGNDGTLKVHLTNGLEIPLGLDASAAFLRAFREFQELKVLHSTHLSPVPHNLPDEDDNGPAG